MSGPSRCRRVLALAVPVVLPVALLAGGGPAAAADAGPGGCGLQLLGSTRSGGATQLLVSAPAAAQVAPPVRTFTLSQDGSAAPVAARAVPPADLAVAVVLASSSGTSPRDFERGRDAALELLVALPAPARTALLSTDRPRPVPVLAADRAASTEGLRRLGPGAAVPADGAVLRAAGLLPRGGHVVLLTDSAPAPVPPALERRLREGGLHLDRIGYGPGAGGPSPAAAGCPSPSANVLRQVDEVAAQLSNRYRLTARLDPSRPATLAVADAGAVSQVLVPPVDPSSAAVADPYPRPAGSSAAEAASYGGAAALGLLGLALLLRRRRRPTGRSPAEDSSRPAAQGPDAEHGGAGQPLALRSGR